MKSLAHWTTQLAEFRTRFALESRLLIAADFDGTLSPLVDHPAEAALVPEALCPLEKLAALHPRVRLAFLSGRALSDLASRLPIGQSNIILAGNHGLELRGAGLDWIHPIVPRIRSLLAVLAVQLQTCVNGIQGAEVEDKGASLTLHFRRVTSADLSRLLAAVTQVELPSCICCHDGNRVLEYRPQVEWNKGHALHRIMQHLGILPKATIFLGDDATDEDAFGELKGKGISLHVGQEFATSVANFYARDPSDAVMFLNELAMMLEPKRSSL